MSHPNVGAADISGSRRVSQQQPRLAEPAATAGQLPGWRNSITEAAARHAFSPPFYHLKRLQILGAIFTPKVQWPSPLFACFRSAYLEAGSPNSQCKSPLKEAFCLWLIRECHTGQDRAIPTPTESAQATKATGDLLRRFKEMRQSVKNEHIEQPRFDTEEATLRVSCFSSWLHNLLQYACNPFLCKLNLLTLQFSETERTIPRSKL